MPRVKIGPALPDREALAVEIAHLRALDITQLRNRWQTVFGRRPPVHLPRHLLFRVLAYRLQADHLGDLDSEKSPEEAGRRAVDLSRRTAELRPGTVLGREWNGRMHRVAVLAENFAWNGKSDGPFAVMHTMPRRDPNDDDDDHEDDEEEQDEEKDPPIVREPDPDE